MRLRGLTLIELLVVVAIMSALMGLIFAGFHRVREKAKQVACASNLRQLGQAFLLYAQDNDGCFPPYRNWPSNAWGDGVTPPEMPWLKGCGFSAHRDTFYAPHLLFLSINPYLRNEDVWFCPSDPYAKTETFYWCIFHKYTSYTYGARSPKYLRDTGYYPPRGKYREPSSVSLACDPKNEKVEWICKPTHPDYLDCLSVWDVPGGNHFEGINMVFLDGHVRWQLLILEESIH